jgi:hypothetical protein
MRGALLALLWSVASPALAWDVAVQPAADALQAGWPGLVWVAVTDDDGQPVAEAPTVRTDGGVVQAATVTAPPGVWPFLIQPTTSVGSLAVTVGWDGRLRTVRVPVSAPPRAKLSIDDDLVADAQRGHLSLLVRGEGLPAAEDLEVAVSEGTVTAVERIPLGLRVDVDTDDDPYPRFLAVGVIDRRHLSAPVWSTVTLRARPALPLTTEPGASVSVEINGRVYGPWKAGERGAVRAVIEQYPGEREARVRVTDVAGNEVSQLVPLPVGGKPLLLALPGGPRAPGEPGPPLLLHAVEANGGTWRTEAPRCRTPQRGELAALDLGGGTWAFPLPVDAVDALLDLRVRCGLGASTQVDLSLGVSEGLPDRLVARVWPEVLSTDFPLADVQMFLEDPAANRLRFTGDVQLEASFGEVELGAVEGPVARAQYRGELAAEFGEDLITARWFSPPGSGPAAQVELSPESVPRGGVAALTLRVLDDRRRPLGGVEVQVDAGAGSSVVLTDDRGFARANVGVPAGTAPVVVRSVVGDHHEATLLVRGTWAARSVTEPDLATTLPIRVDPGRVAAVELQITPPSVAPGPRAQAVVAVRLLDRSGNLAEPGDTHVEAAEGVLTPLPAGPDGALRWSITPPPGFRSREIEVTARSEVLDVEGSAALLVRPRPVRGYFGVSGGVQTNFGQITSPLLVLDGGARIRVRPNEDRDHPSPTRLFGVLSAGWYTGRSTVDTGLGPVGTVRMDVFPVNLGLQLRQEYPTWAVWGGIHGQVLPWWGSQSYDGEPWVRRGGVMPPALAATVGAGVRVVGGEVVFELRGSTANNASTAASLSGFVGGLSAVAGYRLLFR